MTQYLGYKAFTVLEYNDYVVTKLLKVYDSTEE